MDILLPERFCGPKIRSRLRVLSGHRGLLVTTGAALVVLFFGLPTLIIPLATDQVLYALGARTILDGGVLYSDLWEIKAPAVFLIYAAPSS